MRSERPWRPNVQSVLAKRLGCPVTLDAFQHNWNGETLEKMAWQMFP